jgi:hypothetical protein
VEVVAQYGATPGPARLLEEIGRQVVADLLGHGVVRGARIAVPGGAPWGDLRVRVVLSDLEERTQHDTSLQEWAAPGNPSVERLYEKIVEVTVDATLETPAGAVVRSKRFRESVTRQPDFPGQEVGDAVTAEVLRDLARTVRKSLFGGSARALVHRVEQAQAAR